MSREEQKQRSSTELEQLDYEDTLVNLNMLMQQYGCRQAMTDFRDAFPEMFAELVIQINRIPPKDKVAALLR